MWFQCWAALLKILVSLQLGLAIKVRYDDVVQGSILPFGTLDEVVKIGHIGLMVLAVVVVEGLRGEILAESIFRIRKFGKLEGHKDISDNINENYKDL